MTLPKIVENFEKSRNILLDLEKIQDKFGNKFIDLFTIDEFSYWEMSKPLLNLHIIPGIQSRSTTYNLPSLLIRVIKRLVFSKLYNEKISNENHSNIDILCVGFSNYINKDIFNPFISEFNKKKISKKILLINEDTTKSLNDVKCPVIDIFSFTYIGLNNDIENSLKKLTRNWDFLKFYLKNRKIFSTFENFNTFQIFKVFYWLKYIFIPKYISYVLISERIILSTAPKCIIESDIGDPRNRAFILNAKKYKIDTFTLQFAFYNRDSYEWFYAESDIIFVWGVWFSNLFNKNFQVDNKKIVVIGSPRFDPLTEIYIEEQKIQNNKKDILIISSYEIKGYKKVTKTLSFKKYISGLIEKLIQEGYNVHIKIHPLEKKLGYLNKYINNGLQIINIENFHSTLKKVKIVITHGSTLTFDALLMNKIICYPTNKKIVWWDDIFLHNNLGFGFEDYVELNVMLKKLNYVNNNENKNLSDFIFFDNKNNASSRVLDYLLQNNII
jgi:hypothetical protein